MDRVLMNLKDQCIFISLSGQFVIQAISTPSSQGLRVLQCDLLAQHIWQCYHIHNTLRS